MRDFIIVEEKEIPEQESEIVFIPVVIPDFVPVFDQHPMREPCMFDGLPPGVYGLVCRCPRCSPRCTGLGR